jgi:hypothetical protein
LLNFKLDNSMDQVNNTKQDPGIKEQRSNPNEHSNTNLVIMYH